RLPHVDPAISLKGWMSMGDDQPATVAEARKLHNWWTPEDLKQFNAAGDALAAQFSSYEPFPFEGRRRMQVALKGIEELSQHCDSLITIPDEKLITVLGRNATMI
ncbi:hypothetical protein ABGA94_18705, partial [Stenotrophomonas sp. 3diitr2024]